jgi:hypothetical protein
MLKKLEWSSHTDSLDQRQQIVGHSQEYSKIDIAVQREEAVKMKFTMRELTSKS